MASIERSLWRPLCLHSATTATLEPPWRWFCLHSAFFARPVVPLQQLWSFKEGTRVVLQQLHRNRTFWVPATTERPNHFYGRTRVARRSQSCVKGPLGAYGIFTWTACLRDNYLYKLMSSPNLRDLFFLFRSPLNSTEHQHVVPVSPPSLHHSHIWHGTEMRKP